MMSAAPTAPEALMDGSREGNTLPTSNQTPRPNHREANS